MFKFIRNLAVFGLLVAAWKWLKERVCKKKQTEDAGQEQAKPAVSA